MEKKIDWTSIAEGLELGKSQTNSEEWSDSQLIWNQSATLASKKRSGQQVADFGSALSQMKKRMAQIESEEEILEQRTQFQKRNFFSRNQLKYVASVSIILMLSFVALFISQKTGNAIAKQEVEHNQTQAIRNILLKDGTNVSLAQNSKLIYPSEFTDSKRKVKLEGKAFFDVKRDESKPFSIETNQANVEVLGTSFNLADEGDKVELAVKTGKVTFADKSSEKNFKVSAGESARLDVAQNTLTKFTGKDKFGNEGEIIWNNERIIFRNIALEQITNFVSDWKNIDIAWEANAEMKSNSRVTSFETDKSLNEILGNILDGTEIKFENSGNKITLK